MAIIDVEGLGKVEIKGSLPTAQEQDFILDAIREKDIGVTDTQDVFSAGMGIAGTPSDIDLGRGESGALEDYLNSDDFQRLAVEVFGAVGGVATGGALTAARTAISGALRAKPLLTSSLFAGTGEAIGAGVSQTFDPKESVMKEMLRGFATGATGEVLGAVANRAIAKTLSRNKKMIDGADEAVEVIEKQKAKILENPDNYEKKLVKAAKEGNLTPGLLQEGQLLDLAENISELSLIGGASVRYAREGAEELSSEGVTDFVNRFKQVADKQQLGSVTQKILQKNLDVFKRVSNTKYNALDSALQKTNKESVNIYNIKKLATIKLTEMGLKTTNATQRTLLNDIASLPPNISFKKANSIRSELLNIQRNIADPFGNQNKQLATEYAKYITDQMDQALIPATVRTLYDDAQSFYKKGAETFNTDLFKKIAKSNPEDVYKAIIAGGDKPTLIEEVLNITKKGVKDPKERFEIINGIRGEFLDDLINSSTTPAQQFGDILDAQKIDKFMRNKKMVFGKLFEKNQIKQLEKFKNALAFSQGRLKKRGSLPGAIFIQMKQSGAAINAFNIVAATGAGVAGGLPAIVGILLTPAIIAKMFTSPKIIKLLTQGVKYNENQKYSGRIFRQIVSQMTIEGLLDKDEENKVYERMKENNL